MDARVSSCHVMTVGGVMDVLCALTVSKVYTKGKAFRYFSRCYRLSPD